MNDRLKLAVLATALAVASPHRADTVQASSTTMAIGRQDFRNGAVQTAIPLYEIVDISATDMKTPYADNLEISLSTWGAADLANHTRFWQNGALGTDARLTGDVNVGYLKADFLGRAVSLRLGRQIVADGAARMLHLDGGELRLNLPGNFGLSGYVGSPVSPRFEDRGGEFATGNTRANFATGGRASWRSPGLLEVGASVAVANDRGETSRQEVGADFRLTPLRQLAVVGSGWWSTNEARIGEASLAAIVTPIHQVDVTIDYRHVEPDLFLPRDSILSVFAADKRNDIGGAVHWSVLRNLALDGDYHVMLEDAGTGHWARLKATSHPGGPDTTVGAEASYLNHPENGYTLARLFGAKTLAAVTGTLDLYGYFFQKSVNGEDKTLTATATIGYQLARGWRALLAGTAGTTAFLNREIELMAKLVYDQTYIMREVR